MSLHGSQMALTYSDLFSNSQKSSDRLREAVGGSVSGSRKAEGGAGGADESLALVTMANSPSTHLKNRQERRFGTDRAQTLIRQTCGDLPQAKRIVKCGRVPTGNFRPHVKRSENGAFMSGLQTCGSVWGCLRCSYKIAKKRAADITTCVEQHLATGGGVLHVVVTMPHRSNEALADSWSILSDCWGHVTSGRGWQTVKQQHGIIGYIRAAEVTHGNNGWHPHCHVLLFVDRPLSPTENEEGYYALRKAIRDRWCKRMADKHNRTMSEEFGIRVDPVKADDAKGSGEYLTKVGYEMAMTNNKIGRSEGQRHPFAIAHDAAENGDKADVNLLREWIVASHGKRSITWSKGLRDRFDLGQDKTDEELAAEEQQGEDLAEIDTNLWAAICDRRDGLRARFLSAFDGNQCAHQAATTAAQLLIDCGLPATVDWSGKIPVINPTQPPNTTEKHHHAQHQTN